MKVKYAFFDLFISLPQDRNYSLPWSHDAIIAMLLVRSSAISGAIIAGLHSCASFMITYIVSTQSSAVLANALYEIVGCIKLIYIYCGS